MKLLLGNNTPVMHVKIYEVYFLNEKWLVCGAMLPLNLCHKVEREGCDDAVALWGLKK